MKARSLIKRGHAATGRLSQLMAKLLSVRRFLQACRAFRAIFICVPSGNWENRLSSASAFRGFVRAFMRLGFLLHRPTHVHRVCRQHIDQPEMSDPSADLGHAFSRTARASVNGRLTKSNWKINPCWVCSAVCRPVFLNNRAAAQTTSQNPWRDDPKLPRSSRHEPGKARRKGRSASRLYRQDRTR